MSLSEYKKKRSFSKTPEPEGKQATVAGDQLIFVVQKHHASSLHYDFRLELKGTLKSWAVPKGPSLNPADKRLAMLVEDHPFDYKDFEGIIPKGNYGAGTVIVWDQGTYEPAESAGTKAEQEKMLLKGFFGGSLRIKLKGKKLKGEFALVQSKGRGDNAWLLIKKTDRYASATDITLKDKSVASGKTLEQVKNNKQSKQWISNRNADGKIKDNVPEPSARETSAKTTPGKKGKPEELADKDYPAIIKQIMVSLKGTKKTALPDDLKPMLATLTNEPFDDPEWMYEVKWDGYRALAYINRGKVELRSRNNNVFNEKFYPVYKALKSWPVKAVVDGEVVVINRQGHSRFTDIQNWRSEADGELVFYVFDILWLNGIELINLPLAERRDLLRQIVPTQGIIKMSENFETSCAEFLAAAQRMGLEGVIAKKADSVYAPDTRTKLWLKIKTEQRHEAVITGFTKNKDSPKKFSSLILGVYENGGLKFIGQAGTGFTNTVQTEILRKLKPLITKDCPFAVLPAVSKLTRFSRSSAKADITWVKPELVCEVRYQELTSEAIMRHPSFQGLRIDKAASEVVKEEAVPAPGTKLEMELNASEPAQHQEPTAEPNTSAPVQLEAPAVKPKASAPVQHEERETFLHPTEKTQVKAVNGHPLTFTNLNKIYWPKEQITKRDMLNYYHQVAPYMLPYMKDRPQSMNRHPDGINSENFYQKNVAGKVEEWITTYEYESTNEESTTYLVCTDEASLLYMAKMGCIEMNPWHSRISAPDEPDWCVIDLDPDKNTFEQVIETANVVRKILESIEVPSYPKTSGSTGIHIYIPLAGQYSYEQSKQLAELIVTFAHHELGSFTSLERNPAKRKGKIYLDYLQNRATQTIAAPYSLRPKPGATASAPLHWDEVKKGLSMKDFNISNMLDRIKSEGDLFKGVLGKGIDLEQVLKKIDAVFH